MVGAVDRTHHLAEGSGGRQFMGGYPTLQVINPARPSSKRLRESPSDSLTHNVSLRRNWQGVRGELSALPRRKTPSLCQ